MKKDEIARQKLFDGNEEKCLQEVFEIKNQKIKLIDLYNSPLTALKNEIDNTRFDLIVKESQFNLVNSFTEKYISEDGLEINYLKNNDMIFLFSYGEYQPGRYMLFLEGVWHYNLS
ncbi:hypothetical protein [Chryseobacterium arthrosphaerae]|uniref:Uncharacterized protein n=1 Tax=Chryseobacterium arthrosphaerae TaxID=651561 RepID=A0A1B8ZSD2_9FLAO|nr:hypothetical protein [Chryseobacterium arthrosphaerae]OCA74496.1 hypothetical protein BBI00_09220 [Chryseobacterium arthrosphaerae]WES99583.1 hypothetical protein P2W68_08155 [Chryseobacterium arthrosphaerae]